MHATDRSVDLLVRGGTVVTMDAANRILEDCDVAVRDGRIAELGPGLDVEAREVIDARGDVVMPGLVNAHMHENMERGFFEDLPFMQWLQDFGLPKDRAYLPRHARAAAMLNQLEMIAGGTTTFIDIFRYPAEGAAVAERSGLRAVFAPQIIEDPPGAGETLAEAIAFVDGWRERAPGRIQVWFGPHSLYTVSPETLRRVRELADSYGVGIHTHLAESLAEAELVAQASGGKTPTAYLHDLIGLGPDVLCAHCVHLSDDDIALLARTGTAVAHCPTSNMKLGNGFADVPRLLAADVTVGLGTDSMMTNNDLDMFEEMRMAGLAQKGARRDATQLPCETLLGLATTGSAEGLALEGEIGVLAPGMLADVIVVDCDRPHLWPLIREGGGNVQQQLVYACSGADVKTTIVGGRVLMREREFLTLDPEEIRHAVDIEIRDLLTRADKLDAVIGRAQRATDRTHLERS